MGNLYDIVARRSLNYAGSLNPIIYLTVRCFFESFSDKAREDDFFMDFLERKLFIRNNWATKKYKLFKEKNVDGFIYRDTLSLSAFGIIAESYLMLKIADSSIIKNKEYVYSYLLPKRTSSSRNFVYYFNGYKKRNYSINQAFNENQNQIAIVLDLEKFYPSIDKLKSKDIFFDKLDISNNSYIYQLSEKITSSVLEQSQQGIPIGLNINHLIAQTYLDEFDKQLNRKFPNKYFRYVDDIVIICDASEEGDVKREVMLNLPNELKINETKTDRLTYDDWKLLSKDHDNQNESLHDLLHLITAYLSMHPSKLDTLAKDIRKAGYNIPLKRVANQAKNSKFMLFLVSLFEKKKKYGVTEIYFMKAEIIVGKLLALKKFYTGQFKELIKLNYDNDNSAENRSNTQHLKYIINRLLYLSTIDELSELEIPNTEKFNDTKEVIYALSSKDLTQVIRYGGKVVQTVCELWIENEFEILDLSYDDLKKITSIDNVIDSIIVMALYKIINFNMEDILSMIDIENQEYIQVVLDSSYRVKNQDNEFLLEIQGLLKDKSLEEKYYLLTTKYDDKEESLLSGLSLDMGYSL
ncbi:MAG: hypothetical protein GQ531_05955 [Sulfurovum sp.]|nr:hypothetical protein [Sulfurovum sp.]